MEVVKRFLAWIGVKEKIHHQNHKPPFFKEGEVWWCSVGENVGIEVYGKGELFTRPVLILKKYDRFSFFGLPLTTKIKNGSWYYKIIFRQLDQTVILSQGRTFDYRRLVEKVGELEVREIILVRKAFIELHSYK